MYYLFQKYYGVASFMESRATLTPTKEASNARAGDGDNIVLQPPKSPFVTFGKTPPKVFQSKKIRLEFPSSGVSLVRLE